MEDNRCLSVGCVVLRGRAVLLVRHTYGSAKNRILIPGGYANTGEMPEATAEREVLEETGVRAKVTRLLGLRCTPEEWYAVFLMEHVDGEPRSDGDENSEALFLPLEKAAELPDITDFSRMIVRSVLEGHAPQMEKSDYCPSRATPDQYTVFGF